MAVNTKKSLIYVNFRPYENTGKILDYILDNFQNVIVFSFNFYRLSQDQPPSMLTVYRNSKPLYHTRIFQTPTTTQFAFLLLPVRSMVIFIQILFHTYRLNRRYGPFNIFFTVNGFTAWVGNLLRFLKLVQKTVFWVWDYYPPNHKNLIVRFNRWMYRLLDRPAGLMADRTVFLANRLLELRKQNHWLTHNLVYPVVGIGTDPVIRRPDIDHPPLKLVFLGVLKRSHGLDLIFSAANLMRQEYPEMELHIIGGGPDEKYFRQKASRTGLKTIFHGFIADENKVDRILTESTVGLAPYFPDQQNISYFSDSAKIKNYLSAGLPIITTAAFAVSGEIEKAGAGIVINYDRYDLIRALKIILADYRKYRKNSLRLARHYYYRKIYRKIFYS